jgi:hypothetical protein
MKRLIFAACAALALTGCSGLAGLAGGIPPTPVAAADETVLDEQAALAVELAYKAARLAVETGVDAGVVRGAQATRLAELDNQAYAAVLAARRAYRAGNATSYGAALAEARAAIADMLALFA